MRRKHRFHRIGLSIWFALSIFVVLLVTIFITGFLSYIAIEAGFFTQINNRNPLLPLASVLFSCLIVGTIVSYLMGKRPLRMTKEIMDKFSRLAKGDFSVRLDLRHPPEYQDLSDSFNSMAGELGSIEMLRTNFVNNFSHEFKTPIMSIKGFAEMLRDDDLTQDEKKEYLDVVISESQRLADIASNVLDLSKIENQQILADISCFELAEQIRYCILTFAPKWEQKNISVTAEMQDIRICGNEEMLHQVWANLLENAIKFTPENGNIAFSLSVRGEYVIVEIKDDGLGIAPDALAHIFDKFYQADRSRATSGSGLGLTLVKRIVELHGGTLSCRSEAGKGSEFRVCLPIAQGVEQFAQL